MQEQLHNLTASIILLPLIGALTAGLFGKQIGQRGAHWVTTTLVGVSLLLSLYVFNMVVLEEHSYNGTWYTWLVSGRFTFEVGFLIDNLSSIMMVTVTFVSFLVHIYSIGYMAGDPGYQRFFSYISLFTFAMLMLVTANNFMQIFFGWEGVGVVSYLLIGFWFKRDSANFGSLKAFIVNRVGDFGFILAIAAILSYFGTIDYEQVFAAAQIAAQNQTTITLFPGHDWSLITVICILLFVGAMGKSAQVPLHVWLPESMEGPTPISALIHAATMVTAGIFMVCRMSPLFELSEVALSFVLMIGATGALFTGLIAIVQNDIKKVVAYSTLSQLGYMTAALGASAFAAGMFHLVTHAAFKALLFLGAGSVIIACHHNQDMRTMGNLKKYMPITYITFLLGALSLSAIPPFSGFYSKDAIIEAIGKTAIPGSTYAYVCVLLGAFVTALYTFRAFFMTFHTKERMDDHTRSELKESPMVVWLPLVLLAIPSVILGGMIIGPMLYESPGLLGKAIYVAPSHDVLQEMAAHYHGAIALMMHAVFTLPFWLAVSGIFVAWLAYCAKPKLPGVLSQRFPVVYQILIKRYGFDDFNQLFFVNGTRKIGSFFHKVGDVLLIDGLMVNGSGRTIAWISKITRKVQSGYLYHYAFAMLVGLVVFLAWILFK